MKTYDKRTIIVGGFAFIVILALGIFTTLTENGSYHLFFKGKGGQEGDISGPGLIMVAFVFLFIVLWAAWSSFRENTKRRR